MEDVLRKIAELELPMVVDTPTKGAGNCFFEAVVQQLQRQEVQLQSQPQYNHKTLREAVCDFALNGKHVEMELYINRYNNMAQMSGDLFWKPFFEHMVKRGVWAEGPLVRVTGYFLDRNVVVVSARINASNPYLFLDCGDSQFPPLLLANSADNHFQSLLPVDGVTFSKGSSTPASADPSKEDPVTSTPASTDPSKEDHITSSTHASPSKNVVDSIDVLIKLRGKDLTVLERGVAGFLERDTQIIEQLRMQVNDYKKIVKEMEEEVTNLKRSGRESLIKLAESKKKNYTLTHEMESTTSTLPAQSPIMCQTCQTKVHKESTASALSPIKFNSSLVEDNIGDADDSYFYGDYIIPPINSSLVEDKLGCMDDSILSQMSF